MSNADSVERQPEQSPELISGDAFRFPNSELLASESVDQGTVSNTLNPEVTDEVDTANDTSIESSAGSGVLALVDSSLLPVSYDRIGEYVDLDGGEVCSYDALATRKIVPEMMIEGAKKMKFVFVHPNRYQPIRIIDRELRNIRNTDPEIAFTDTGMPVAVEPEHTRLVVEPSGELGTYSRTLKHLAIWTDVSYANQKKIDKLSKKLTGEKPLRRFGRTERADYSVAAQNLRLAFLEDDDTFGQGKLHVGYRLDNDLLMPLVSLQQTADGCEFVIETGQETEDESYNKPLVVRTLREAMTAIAKTEQITPERENELMLPFIEAYIESLRGRAGTATAIEILEYMHGLRPEGMKMKDLAQKIFVKPAISSPSYYANELVTGLDSQGIVSHISARPVVARSGQFMTKIAGRDQETEAIVIQNEPIKNSAGLTTASYTVYMGPSKAVFGRTRYYPVYDVTKDDFGFLRLYEYNDLLKPSDTTADPEHIEAIHSLFINPPKSKELGEKH